MLQELRAATKPIHDKAETLSLASKIIDHTITKDEYKQLLLQHFKIYSAVETFVIKNKALLPNPICTYAGKLKSSKLKQDLKENYGICEFDLPQITPIQLPATLPSILGALYVIEGSMLGGLLIKKNLQECVQLNFITEHYFFNDHTKDVISKWKSFCAYIESTSFDKEEITMATYAAEETFTIFIKNYITSQKKL